MEDESGAGFPILLHQHIDRFRPAGNVEFAMIEEMSAARWRQRSAWSMETLLIDTQTAAIRKATRSTAWSPPSTALQPRQPYPS
jgi:hypothetical protein